VTRQEKVLYHQIHPLKLLTDWVIGGVPAYILVWHHHLVLGVAVAFVPSIVVTLLLVRYADLERYKQSAFGRYVASFMPQSTQGIRFVGAFVAGLGAWWHNPAIIVLGVAITLLAWANGLLPFRRR
jgi:hypothetical protein